ncbi:MAG: hypothetical protein H0U75_06805 [Legionella sp.]|nr:hypothetical protein [Legionella sp.]
MDEKAFPLTGYVLNKSGIYLDDGRFEIQRNTLYLSYDSHTPLNLHFDLRNRYQSLLTPSPEYQAEIRNLSVGHRYSKWSWLFGRQFVTWGKADGFRLLDVVNAYDYTEFVLDDMNEAKRPLTMLRLDYCKDDNDGFQVLLMPEYLGDLLPPKGSQFNPFPTVLPWVEPNQTNNPAWSSPSNWQYGFKYEHTQDTISYTLNYLNKWSSQPLYDINYAQPLYILAHPVREQLVGGSLDVSWQSYVFRSELAYYPEKQLPIRNPLGFLEYRSFSSYGTVIGVDRLIGEWFVSLQVFYTKFVNNAFDPVFGPMQRTFTCLVMRSFLQDKLRFRLFMAYDETNSGVWSEPTITYDMGSGIETTLGFDQFKGSKNSLFGRYSDNSRAYLLLRWTF